MQECLRQMKKNSEQKISEETEERAQTQTVKAERPEMTEHAERSEKRPEEKTGLDFSQLDSGQTVTGILEVMPDGFGLSDPITICRVTMIFMFRRPRSEDSI